MKLVQVLGKEYDTADASCHYLTGKEKKSVKGWLESVTQIPVKPNPLSFTGLVASWRLTSGLLGSADSTPFWICSYKLSYPP